MRKKTILILISLVSLIVISGIFHYRSYLKAQYNELKRVTGGESIFDFSFADAGSRKISFYSDSLKIIGDLYEAEIKKPPCLILLHGTNKLGRKQPIIMSLAKEFQKLNYTVLAIDFRGYNESEVPHKINSVKDLDFGRDAISAIDFLVEKTGIDTSRVYVLGHSFGAGATLSVQWRDKRIKKIILFGPPRRVSARIIDSLNDESYRLLSRMISNMAYKVEADTAILLQEIQNRNIENYVKQFGTQGHIPVFLIDGGKEHRADLEFLKSKYDQMVPPKDYWTVPAANHYLNTGVFFGKPIYNDTILQSFVRRIDNWIKQKN